MNCDLDLNALNFQMLIKKKKKNTSIYLLLYTTVQPQALQAKQGLYTKLESGNLQILCLLHLKETQKAENVEENTFRTSTAMSQHSLPPPLFHQHHRLLRRQLHAPPLPQRPLSRSLQNGSSPCNYLSLSLSHTHTHTHTHTLRRVLEEGFFILLTN